jgi:hypothetical protein
MVYRPALTDPCRPGCFLYRIVVDALRPGDCFCKGCPSGYLFRAGYDARHIRVSSYHCFIGILFYHDGFGYGTAETGLQGPFVYPYHDGIFRSNIKPRGAACMRKITQSRYFSPVPVDDDGKAVTILPPLSVITVMQVAGLPLLSKPISAPVSRTRQELQLLFMGDGSAA